MPLRKVNLAVAATPSNNMASFVNVTAKRLFIMRTVLKATVAPTVVALDHFVLSIDEVPTVQARVNDSRAHITDVRQIVGDATGAGLAGNPPDREVLSFRKNDLILDPDEALFMNGEDIAGTPTLQGACNIWYDD